MDKHYYSYLEFAKTVRTSEARDCFKQRTCQTRRGAPGSAMLTPKHDPTFRQTDQKAPNFALFAMILSLFSPPL